jgi:drug/metabolite transporter (DMT)-like permease
MIGEGGGGMTGKARMYFTLAVIALVSQLAIVGVFLADEGLDLGKFADQAVESTIAVLALADLLVSGVIFLIWSRIEARRVGVDPWWPFVVALAGGLCFAFALFLGYRERRVAGVASDQHGQPATATAPAR